MKCPHCLENCYVGTRTAWDFAQSWQKQIMYLGSDPDGHWWIEKIQCPNPVCGRIILGVINCEDAQRVPDYPQSGFLITASDERIVHVRPKTTNRPPIPVEVPSDFAEALLPGRRIMASSCITERRGHDTTSTQPMSPILRMQQI